MSEPTRVLIVEDDPDGQVVVSHVVMQTLAMPVDIASNAQEALNYLEAHQGGYRIAIIDLSLPEVDGWQLMSSIRQNPTTADLPCVAVTAYHSSKTREEALRWGFVGYFSKPIDTSTFTQQLRKFII